MNTVLMYLFCFVYGVVCFCLIGAVMMQTSKAEGLAGILGGGMQNDFKGKEAKNSREETFKTWTNYLCIAYVVLSILLSLFFNHLSILK